MANKAIIGTQWGDEGKGKEVDVLAREAEIVIRYQGGSNAGHTIKIEGKKYVLHLVPSGAVSAADGVISVMGQGMVIYPPELVSESAM